MSNMNGLPAVIFAMRYSNAVGFVHNSMARLYDRVANLLDGDLACFIAYPELTETPQFNPSYLRIMAADFYDTTASNRFRLRSIIVEHRVRLIVYMGPTRTNILFWRRLGVHTIDYAHDGYAPNRSQSHLKKLIKNLLRRRLRWNLHDLYVANAENLRTFLLDYAQLPENRVLMIRNGIDVSHFSLGRAPSPLELHIPVTEYYALTICQARPEKRVDMIIEAAARLFNKIPELSITFLHVGSGQCLEMWQRKADSMGLKNRICFLGYKNDPLPYLRLASFYLHASERESFGLAIAEAMGCGKPVICFDAFGPRELVEHGVTGFLIPQGEVEAFSDAILTMVASPAMIERMGHAGRERAVTWFSLDRQAAEFADLVRRSFGRAAH